MFPLTNLIAGGVAGVALGAPARRGRPASPGRLLAARLLPGKLASGGARWPGRGLGGWEGLDSEFPPVIIVTDDLASTTHWTSRLPLILRRMLCGR